MKMSPRCVTCQLKKATDSVNRLTEDVNTREACLRALRDLADRHDETECAPLLVWRMNRIIAEYCGSPPSYTAEKQSFNRFVFSMENTIWRKIISAPDALMQALVYARIGNYIDYGAMRHVDTSAFCDMLDKQADSSLPTDTYTAFRDACIHGHTFLLLTDNAGEIVLDKLFLRVLHETYPHLSLYVMVRGGDILNDATREDAVSVGLADDPSLPVILLDNGAGVAGVIPAFLSDTARDIFYSADVILSKGQANFESLYGCGMNVFYAFLCKCALFADRFGVGLFTGMFLHETDFEMNTVDG